MAFSLSHCAAGGLCAAAWGPSRIGADWEGVEPREEAVVRLYAHPEEISEALLSSPEEATRLWTLKEAVLKLLGTGLACDPRDVRGLPGLELHGSARGRWEELGRPRIAVEHTRRGTAVVCVARTEGD